MDWVNPHVIQLLSVEDADGTATIWRFEVDPPSALLRRGWMTDAIAAAKLATNDLPVPNWPPYDGNFPVAAEFAAPAAPAR